MQFQVVDLWDRSGHCHVWSSLGFLLPFPPLKTSSHSLFWLLLPPHGGSHSVHHLQGEGATSKLNSID